MHSISELKLMVEEELGRLTFNQDPRNLYDPITYMLSLDAKRLRPVLLLSACELFNGNIHKAMGAAAGIEVFHNFTLLHDDIMDNAPLRRSSPTVHEKWNSNVAILSGDTMFVKACQLMMTTDDSILRKVMELFHSTAVEVCEGQQMDMNFEESENVTIDDYIKMITLKTAVLLAASLKTGALIAEADNDDAQHLYEFGKNTGIAFQLKDDMLDVYGDDKKFGKLKGGDIVANKKTFLLLKALELADGTRAEKLNGLLADKKLEPVKKAAAVTAIYNQLGILQIAELEMEKYFQKALFHLDAVNVPESRKEVLRSFAGRLMVREA
jgi:geranylgeranyl diphosphate synthase, type II